MLGPIKKLIKKSKILKKILPKKFPKIKLKNISIKFLLKIPLNILRISLKFMNRKERREILLNIKMRRLFRKLNKNMPEIARNEIRRQNFVNLLKDVDLKQAMKRCNLKYEVRGGCKAVDLLTVCRVCKKGFELYRTNGGNCGCDPSLTLTLNQEINEDGIKPGILENENLHGTTEAFYFQVEDLYHK